MKQFTQSIHNGSKYSREHNARVASVVKKEEHIDITKMHINYIDHDLKQMYRSLFGEALHKYNEKIKKKHPERVKTIDQYLKEIIAKMNKSKNSKKACYEVIVQIGNFESKPDDETLLHIYKDFVDDWQRRNPNLIILGAYIHFDEVGGGHMHIDYIPCAHCSRGIEIQPNLTQALKEMGFDDKSINNTAQMQWQNNEREVLKNICKNYDIEIISGDHSKEHFEKQTFIAKKEMQKMQNKYDDLYNDLYYQIENLQNAKDTLDNNIDNFKKEDLEDKLQNYQNCIIEYKDILEDLLTQDDGSEYFKAIRQAFEILKTLLFNYEIIKNSSKNIENFPTLGS